MLLYFGRSVAALRKAFPTLFLERKLFSPRDRYPEDLAGILSFEAQGSRGSSDTFFFVSLLAAGFSPNDFGRVAVHGTV